MDRFTKYIPDGEPVITINLIATVLFGITITVLDRVGVQLAEIELTLMGIVFLSVATWLARAGVFSPATHKAEVEAALHTTPPGP